MTAGAMLLIGVALCALAYVIGLGAAWIDANAACRACDGEGWYSRTVSCRNCSGTGYEPTRRTV